MFSVDILGSDEEVCVSDWLQALSSKARVTAKGVLKFRIAKSFLLCRLSIEARSYEW